MDYEYVKLTHYRSFGDMLSQKRQALGMSLRKLSRELEIDPTNLSKMVRGKQLPPTDMEVLCKWARVLGMEKDFNEYYTFIDWAYITHREIPPDIPIERLLNYLPAYFRKIRNHKRPKRKDIDTDIF